MAMSFTALPKEINHKWLFCFGVLYYFIAPLIIHQSTIFDDLPGINAWKDDVQFTDTNKQLYLILVFLFFITFFIGSFIGSKYVSIKYHVTEKLGNMSAMIIFMFVTVIVIVFMIKMHSLAFRTGYHGDKGEDGIGVVSTSNLLLFYIHFVYDQGKKTKNLFLILLICNSIFLLGLGGRMYVIMPVVAYYIRGYNNARANNKSMMPYVFIPLLVALSAALVGALRIGENVSLISYFIFAEPIFTSYSAFTFITRHPVELFVMPYNFIVSFLNIIPSLVWPDKIETIALLLTDWEKNFESPLGALSVFVSVFADFGIILGSIFMILIGVMFGHLYKAFKTNKINKNIYYCFCCVLPFSFFRDPIAIPIKIYILSFIILPFFMQILRQVVKRTDIYK